MLIPNRILIIIDKAVQLILTPWYGKPLLRDLSLKCVCENLQNQYGLAISGWPGWPRPCGLGPCVCFSNVNLAFGTYEYNVPAAVARVFGAGVNPNWHTETAHFLCALSKIVYEVRFFPLVERPCCTCRMCRVSWCAGYATRLTLHNCGTLTSAHSLLTGKGLHLKYPSFMQLFRMSCIAAILTMACVSAPGVHRRAGVPRPAAQT